jgi:hypothetical protein
MEREVKAHYSRKECVVWQSYNNKKENQKEKGECA